MLLIVVAVVSAALGFGAAFLLYRPDGKLYEVQTFVEAQKLPTKLRRFRVIMGTERGAEARRLYERLVPKGDGIVEFYDHDARRSVKGDV